MCVRSKTLISRYYEEIVLALFCVGLGLYAIGLDNMSMHFRAQSFFHIGGLVYILVGFRQFGREDLRALRVVLISFGVVIVLGLLSYCDEIMPMKFSKVLNAVNTHIVNYLVLFVVMFLYARHAKRRNVMAFFVIFALMCAINVGATLIESWRYDFGRSHNVPFFFKAVFTYNIWLIAPMALCISGMVACRHIGCKIACAVGIIIVCAAMMANGERSFLVASFVMVFVPFIVWHYRGKTLPLVFGIGLVAMVGAYHYTKGLSDRYNFAHMIDNFWEVVRTPVVEMGKYDELCFSGQFVCTEQSTQNGRADFSWEHSSLMRIAMSKSTFEAFWDAPWTPRVVGVFQIGEYLWRYYEANEHRAHNRVYMSVNPHTNGYNHPHNFVVSVLFCYGIVGFVAIAGFVGFVLYTTHGCYDTRDRGRAFVALWAFVCLVGICVQGFFDAFYPNILAVLFVFIGGVVGLCCARDSGE